MFIPSTNSSPSSNEPTLTVALADKRAIVNLINTLLDRSHLSLTEVADRLGIKVQSLAQYRYGRRSNPSLAWMVRLAEVCGGRVIVELPTSRYSNKG